VKEKTTLFGKAKIDVSKAIDMIYTDNIPINLKNNNKYLINSVRIGFSLRNVM
jgi:hypothetical protein